MANKLHYTGLNAAQVAASREQHGANVLSPVEKDPWWRKLLEKFRDPLIVILLIAGVMSIGISFYEYYRLHQGSIVFYEPVGIFIAIALATGLAFIFEYKAEKEFEILNQVNDDEAVQVIRDGKVQHIARRDVVVGDIVMLNTGEEVPADSLLLESHSLLVDESSLTGEPQCAKFTDEALFDLQATYPSNHVLKGTKVMEGHGIAEVTAVGDATENGKVMESAQLDSSVKTPLNEQLDGLGKLIAQASYLIAALVIVGRVVAYFVNTPDAGINLEFLAYLLQTLMIAVTLVVVAVPEGLPMAVTLSLAYSMRRMLKTNNLVRRMHACETMGAATVICTDKTGTLTQNQMNVHHATFFGISGGWLYNDEQATFISENIAANSTAHLSTDESTARTEVIGNPTEGALLLWLKSQGVDYADVRNNCEVIEEVPFDTERKYMATVVHSNELNCNILYVKGAPEIVGNMCSAWGEMDRDTVRSMLLDFQNKAMRTLAFAYKVLKPGENPIANKRITATDLTFMGVVAIADPVREDVPPAIMECIKAGIDVKIITGDTAGTAREVGRQIGLWHDDVDNERNIITGPEIEAMTDEELESRVMDLKIIARSRPNDKKRIVEALQRCNQVVAVTGDGTNDAPALKAAHVGLSMGDGTSVAKEASDITIIDNSFASIGNAVAWGRSLYRNIQRFLLFQLTVNVAACLVVLAGSFMDIDAPLTVTQMLWVNLIMDTFAAMALSSLPPNKSLMRQKPRDRKAFIIDRHMANQILWVGLLFSAILIAIFYVIKHCDVKIGQMGYLWEMISSGFHKTSNHHIYTYESALFFTIFVMMQFWNLFNARAYKSAYSAFHLKNCK
ncbi:MAG: calcium-translocating P-type ATPase, PMCA-type, partial [Muribaculaceae bacterium]|nr:calcium-translocating P-type ATPase, PMCA-type [Muribaculaceae bacterium]